MDFFQVFDSNYYEKLNERADSFKEVFRLCKERGVKRIVETGTCRTGDWIGDGCSTVLFGHYAASVGGKVTTVDIDSQAISLCKSLTTVYSGCIEYVVGDSIEFLRGVDYSVELLYLDSYDFGPHIVKESQEHSLEEAKAAFHNLSDRAIVVIDDCKLPSGGKGGLSVPWLLRNGFELVFGGYQFVFARN